MSWHPPARRRRRLQRLVSFFAPFLRERAERRWRWPCWRTGLSLSLILSHLISISHLNSHLNISSLFSFISLPLSLCACVNIVPGVESMYRWKGKIETDNELLLIIKTTEEQVPNATASILSNHEYDVPEVIALPVLAGESSKPYVDWLRKESHGRKMS